MVLRSEEGKRFDKLYRTVLPSSRRAPGTGIDEAGTVAEGFPVDSIRYYGRNRQKAVSGNNPYNRTEAGQDSYYVRLRMLSSFRGRRLRCPRLCMRSETGTSPAVLRRHLSDDPQRADDGKAHEAPADRPIYREQQQQRPAACFLSEEERRP